MITEAERFNVNHPQLCPHLRWKSFFIRLMLTRRCRRPTPDTSGASTHTIVWVRTAKWPSPAIARLPIGRVMEPDGHKNSGWCPKN
jgi:hypothetical protein